MNRQKVILGLVLGLLTATSAGAGTSTAVPVLEVEARGLRVTNVEIPFCGVACDRLYPEFLSLRYAFMRGGRVVGTVSVNELDDAAAGSTAVAFEGLATPAEMSALQSRLLTAAVGFEQGGCSVVFGEAIPDEPYPTTEIYELSYRLLWYGRGNRFNLFDLPLGIPACDPPLRNLVSYAVFLARDVQGRAAAQ